MKEIVLNHELERLHSHLCANARSILSAAFGNGKTTLLKQFKERYSEEFLIVTLHPVNYSVATNEDVFEYIKRDILIQLNREGVPLSTPQFEDYSKALITKDNVFDLIGFLASMLGSPIVKSIWDRNKGWLKKTLKLAEDIENEMHNLDRYNSFFKAQRGGIYEQDAYSVLIEETLASVHAKDDNRNGKKTLLIIEDLDRIDPAHLFRLLNVFGAYVDTANGVNKFGFTNILLVLDYNTTKQVFHHFYGSNANYTGYISKFLCSHVFHFSILQAARQELFAYLVKECLLGKADLKNIMINIRHDNAKSFYTAIFSMSVRDIAHLLDGIDDQISSDDILSSYGKFVPKAPITKMLAVLVRMNQQVDFSTVFDSLYKSQKLLVVLDKFLLCRSTLCNSVGFEYHFSNYCVVVTNEGNDYVGVSLRRVSASSSRQESVDNELHLCYDQAMKAVVDCLYLD